MKSFRESVIESVRAMNITQEELGFTPRVIKYVDADFIDSVKRYIQQVEEVEAARECIPESYWEELGIAETKYKVIEVELSKTIYKKIQIALPENVEEDEYLNGVNFEDVEYNNFDISDEDEWDIYDSSESDSDLTYDDLKMGWNNELWNWDEVQSDNL